MPLPDGIVMAHGVSGAADALRAAEEAAAACAERLGRRSADIAFVFYSKHHADAAKGIAGVLARRLGARVLLGASAESVIGGRTEIEQSPGVALLVGSMPGVRLTEFCADDLPDGEATGPVDPEYLGHATGMDDPDHRATVLIADPFSVAVNALVPALSAARMIGVGAKGRRDRAERPPVVVGGVASAGDSPGRNTLVLDGTLYRRGLVGVSFAGAVRVGAVVSQGCRPFGPVMTVTKARGQIIGELDDRPSLQALHEAFESLDDHGKKLMQRGVFLGVATSEKERYGRDDFLIRNIVAADQKSGSIVVADLPKVGQSVRFHVRDAATAEEDLAMLLDGQQLYGRPAGVLLFSCNARGKRLFSSPHHDARAIARAFADPAPGSELAKAGTKIEAEGGAGAGPDVPLAGFFAAGEIGPVGDGVFLHGHTASMAIFRSPEAELG